MGHTVVSLSWRCSARVRRLLAGTSVLMRRQIVMNPRLLSTYADQLLELSKADFVVTDKPLKDLPEPLRLISIPTSQLDCQLGLSTTKDKGLFGDPSVVKEDDHAYANHSSGSTSCPKLLHFTHKQVMESFRLTNGAYPPGKRRWFASAFYVSTSTCRRNFRQTIHTQGLPAFSQSRDSCLHSAIWSY